ncbi:hypothetical protein [Spirillospora sp. NPDC048824]|uniref:hypothetical protein n=1 Tax=Spirillospora sp. NPDC048824 TaxID=3364526 RepID=UPI003721F5BC
MCGVFTGRDPAEFSRVMRPGEVPGSLRYLASELGGHAGDGRSDLSSAGVVLHELLTGRHPAEPPRHFPR